MSATVIRLQPPAQQAPQSVRRASLVAFVALFSRDLAVLRSQLGMFLGRTVLQPLLLIFVFTYVFPKIGQGIGGTQAASAFNDVLLGGVIGSTIILQGIQAVALPMVLDFGRTREIEDRVLAPLPVSAVALEKVLSGAVQGLISALIVFPLAYLIPATPVHLHVQWIYLVTLLPLGCLLSAALGLAIGTRISADQVAIVFGILVVPMTFLGAVYYTWGSLGQIEWLKWAVTLNPLVYLSEGLRAALAGPTVPHMATGAIYGAMLAFTAVLLAAGLRGFQRQVVS
jgi:ABC-2 type transport system permease protein